MKKIFNESYQKIVCWIPHCSDYLPFAENASPDEVNKLNADNYLLTDNFIDKIFCPSARCVKGEYSRFFCDLERYEDDSKEEMSRVGMGMLYTKFLDGSTFCRNIFSSSVNPKTYYRRKHAELKTAVEQAGAGCLLLDIHSFCSVPLPCDKDKDPDRPLFCIGVNDDDTRPESIERAIEFLNRSGYKTFLNKPFCGAMTTTAAVKYKSVMIEINKKLYLRDNIYQEFDFALKNKLNYFLKILLNLE